MSRAKQLPANATCVYCGTHATCLDHVIANKVLRPFGGERRARDWVVPACRDCNAMLSSRALFSVPSRAEWLYGRYRKKFQKLMLCASWTDDELEELDGTLRGAILQTQLAQAELDHRLAHLRMVAAMGWDYMRPVDRDDLPGEADAHGRLSH